MRDKTACVKEFSFDDIKVSETVAEYPSILSFGVSRRYEEDHFCLRIDADEYEPDTFAKYMPIFRDTSRAVTVFFNVSAYVNAVDEILSCKKAGLEIQSHGYYHHTYKDQANNFYNIKKAGDFFKRQGIDVNAFAAPYGRWNAALGRALERIGYEYSSEFSYDYMSSPGHPEIDGRTSSVLEIPIFPVAPELFFEKGYKDAGRVISYYKKAIDLMREIGVPVIVYAHINPKFPEVPVVLRGILDYALGTLKMTPANMSDICRTWKNGNSVSVNDPAKKKLLCDVPPEFFGKRKKLGWIKEFKIMVKEAVDYDVATPIAELQGGPWNKIYKKVLRSIFLKGS